MTKQNLFRITRIRTKRRAIKLVKKQKKNTYMQFKKSPLQCTGYQSNAINTCRQYDYFDLGSVWIYGCSHPSSFLLFFPLDNGQFSSTFSLIFTFSGGQWALAPGRCRGGRCKTSLFVVVKGFLTVILWVSSFYFGSFRGSAGYPGTRSVCLSKMAGFAAQGFLRHIQWACGTKGKTLRGAAQIHRNTQMWQ